jgi:hypothetical protein
MQIKEDKRGVIVTIPRPKDMSVVRFDVLVTRLSKIIDQLGGSLYVKSE